MPAKPRSYCGKCRVVHDDECPKRSAYSRTNDGKVTSGRGGSKWGTTRERIFNRDMFLCQIHKAKGVYVSVELHGVNHGICDHIVALKHGGVESDENLQTICQACNTEKTWQESMKYRDYE